jgi:hypothetical protein
MPTLIDSYPESNQDDSINWGGADVVFNGQAITVASSFIISSIKGYIKKGGTPPGIVYASVYTSTGTVGTNAKPVTLLTHSTDSMNASTLTTSFALYEFTFTGAEAITMNAGTNYCIGIENDYGTREAKNSVILGTDTSSPTHGGNYCYYLDSTTSGYFINSDLIFYLYGVNSLIGPFPVSLTL